MPENNEIKDSLEKTIDTLFSDTPGAPVKAQTVKAPAPKVPAPKAQTPAPKAETPAPKAETPAPKAETPAPKAQTPAPKAQTSAPKNALTVTELKKLLERPAPKPLEKAPVWSTILAVCTIILSLSLAGVAVIAAYFYFGPGADGAAGKPLLAYLSMIMCIVVCAVVVGFAVGNAFMLRKIEKDIREIKSKL